ncbi:hypothetical protein Q5752_005708 [Cryptotrichosporon argae]
MIPKLAAAAAALALAHLAVAVPCVQFDTSWNLYAFGGSSDVNLGQNTTWSSPSAQTLTSTGRPPWTGNQTQCLLSQYNNAMYVFGADASDVSTIYIYDFGAGSWTTQTTSSAPSALGNSRSSIVLDHDTNTVYTIPGAGQPMYTLDMSTLTTAASSSALAWSEVENPSFDDSSYTVTAAQAANHILFFGVPSTPAGEADIFVVHYSYFQPNAQTFNATSGSNFPDTSGQAFSIPDAANDVPYQIVFVPDDFSGSYVVTHWTDLSNYATTSDAPMALSLVNSTQTLPAPTSQDAQAAYAASDTALVQIDADGNIYYMLSAVNADYTVASSPSWTKMSYQLSGGSVSSSSIASASASTSGSASTTISGSSATASGASATASGASKSGSATVSASGSASASASSTSGDRMAARADVLGFALALVGVAAAALF